MDMDNRLKMWIWRRMIKVSWKEHRTNEDILSMVQEERSMVSTIRNKQKNWRKLTDLNCTGMPNGRQENSR